MQDTTRLDTLLFLAGESLTRFNARLEDAANLSPEDRVGLVSCLGTLRNILEMVDEIAVCHQDTLYGVALALHELRGTSDISWGMAEVLVKPYVTNMGEMAADKFFAAALGT